MRRVRNCISKFDHFIKLCGCSMRAEYKAKSSNDFSYPVIKITISRQQKMLSSVKKKSCSWKNFPAGRLEGKD